MNDDLKNILKIVIGVTLIVFGVKFFVALLPVILLVLLGYLIYCLYMKTKGKTIEKININVNNKSNKSKKRVQEAEIVREKNED